MKAVRRNVAADAHVFYDPKGKRWSVVKRLGLAVGLLASLAGVVLCITVLLLPVAPGNILDAYHFHPFNLQRPSRVEAAQAFMAQRLRDRLLKRIRVESTPKYRAAHTANGALDTVIGFYVNWEPNSYTSLQAHADDLTYLMPEWYGLSRDAGDPLKTYFDKTSDPKVITLCKQHTLPIIPILNNVEGDDFSWAPLQQLLKSPQEQQTLIARLVKLCKENGYAGINIDFEPPYDLMTDAEMTAAYPVIHNSMPVFMTRLHAAFAPQGLLVTQDVPVLDKNFDFKKLNTVNDLVVLMLYDQHTPQDEPGPIASQNWIEDAADAAFKDLDANKVILGLGNYAYDWPIKLDKKGDMEKSGTGRELMDGPALNIARQAGVQPDMDEGDLNPYFTYDDAGGQTHILYMLDAVTAYNTVQALRGYEPRGAALWYLGAEDPSIWSFFTENALKQPLHADGLQKMNFNKILDTDVEHRGDEFMQIVAVAQPGQRKLDVDDDGLVTDEEYTQFPSPFVMRQFGATGKKLAITFDDGPDPSYTPKILDILREHHVNATFFVVGDKAAQYPQIVKQSWADGNELGNHTYTHPHIMLVSPVRAEMELNATQRIIEALTGHMSLLFRPPYGDNPDSSTLVAADTPLIQHLYEDRFLDVGMGIDPEDFFHIPPKGKPLDIVHGILSAIHDNPNAHVILLHDSGGNRDNTVAALPRIIEVLQAQGYQLTTVSGLLGPGWHNRLFPPVPPEQAQLAGLDRIIFNVWYSFAWLLGIAFLLAIGLGVLRLLVFGVLAVTQYRRTRRAPRETGFTAPVTVVVPAYNEAAVVARTVASVLGSDYPTLRVVVVDDGSTDDTSAVLHAHFDADRRVTIITKENGGKATALNTAFALADTDVVVCMDADTMFASDTVRRLVQPFVDPRVGAVAGNVKVGNRVNLLAVWQSLEYITSQNFDRLAFAALDSVSVVPGAVGAWRRAAVVAVGGFETNTLAEDTDLTFRIRLNGWYTRCANDAVAYTEAPDSVGALAKQRFRWAFGILQALWKHKRRLFNPRYGGFSCVVMPSMWLFNILLQALAPVVDITIILALFNHQVVNVLFYTAIFFVLDLTASFAAFAMDKENPVQIAWLFLQRFFYRQFLYYIIVLALFAALRGGIVGWGKLNRKANVTLPNG